MGPYDCADCGAPLDGLGKPTCHCNESPSELRATIESLQERLAAAQSELAGERARREEAERYASVQRQHRDHFEIAEGRERLRAIEAERVAHAEHERANTERAAREKAEARIRDLEQEAAAARERWSATANEMQDRIDALAASEAGARLAADEVCASILAEFMFPLAEGWEECTESSREEWRKILREKVLTGAEQPNGTNGWLAQRVHRRLVASISNAGSQLLADLQREIEAARAEAATIELAARATLQRIPNWPAIEKLRELLPPDECDQCGAKREDWQDLENVFCPNHANPMGSCDGLLRPAPAKSGGASLLASLAQLKADVVARDERGTIRWLQGELTARDAELDAIRADNERKAKALEKARFELEWLDAALGTWDEWAHSSVRERLRRFLSGEPPMCRFCDRCQRCGGYSVPRGQQSLCVCRAALAPPPGATSGEAKGES